MNEFEAALREFHTTYGMIIENVPVASQPTEVRKLREDLIDEEYRELKEALDEEDIYQICKEGIDLLYVVLGMLVTYGVPITQCFEEVQRSNMSKLDADGKPIYREDGKVLKGPNYTPADIKRVVDEFVQSKNETL